MEFMEGKLREEEEYAKQDFEGSLCVCLAGMLKTVQEDQDHEPETEAMKVGVLALHQNTKPRRPNKKKQTQIKNKCEENIFCMEGRNTPSPPTPFRIRPDLTQNLPK